MTGPGEKQAADFLDRRAVLLAAAMGIFLVILNVTIIFNEGWEFSGYPHSYQYSALQQYYDRFNPGSEPPQYYFPAGGENDNEHFSVLYALSSLLGRIGQPTPPWFRLSAVFLWLFVYILAYWHLPKGARPSDRLITAVMVGVTPVVLTMGRHLEDHIVHIALLLVTATILGHGRLGADRRRSWPLYFLPGLAALLTHMLTNFLIMMLSFAGMILYSYFVRRKELLHGRVLLREVGLWLASGVVAAAVMFFRISRNSMEQLSGYYVTEAANQSGSWLTLLAYPEVLVLSAAGVSLCILALIAFSPPARSKQAGLYFFWLVLPLVVLTFSQKKNTYYIWYAAPAVTLLAAGVIRRTPQWAKAAVLLICLTAAGGHLVGQPAYWERVIHHDLFQGQTSFELRKRNNVEQPEILAEARKMLELAAGCGELKEKSLLVLSDRWASLPLAFALMYLERGRYYLPHDPEGVWPKQGVVVDSLPIGSDGTDSLIPGAQQRYLEFITSHQPTFTEGDYRIYCLQDSRPENVNQLR